MQNGVVIPAILNADKIIKKNEATYLIEDNHARYFSILLTGQGLSAGYAIFDKIAAPAESHMTLTLNDRRIKIHQVSFFCTENWPLISGLKITNRTLKKAQLRSFVAPVA